MFQEYVCECGNNNGNTAQNSISRFLSNIRSEGKISQNITLKYIYAMGETLVMDNFCKKAKQVMKKMKYDVSVFQNQEFNEYLKFPWVFRLNESKNKIFSKVSFKIFIGRVNFIMEENK